MNMRRQAKPGWRQPSRGDRCSGQEVNPKISHLINPQKTKDEDFIEIIAMADAAIAAATLRHYEAETQRPANEEPPRADDAEMPDKSAEED